MTIRRRNQTFCLLCDDTDTIRSIKEKLVQATNQHSAENDDENLLSADDLRLLKPGSKTDAENVVLKDDDQVIHNLELPKDNATLYMVHKISDDDTWESVDIVSTSFDAT